ncbi:Helix-turn-helix, type 11 [Mycobacteroides abscessus subsp. abscessus]|nr:Helix-turn-helix, type 11 [Mycobacteroides abscessus subsp. abscessus]HEO8421996.1 YafY family transcriptional regulator [Yersinia enterocolitica]
MKISRLFQILYILLERKSITANELAEKFEVSVRTIYRDIQTLTESGIPIYTTQGKGGGITLMDQFILNKSLLLDKEQDEILFSLQSLSATNYPETDEIVAKLSHLFQKSETKWIEVDFSAWGSDTKRKEYFTLFRKAILERHVLSFHYINSNGEKSQRRILATKLLFKDKAWYLEGFCLEKAANRTFKINRMSKIALTNEMYDNIKKMEESILNDSLDGNHLDWADLVLRISSRVSYRIFDEFEEKDISKEEDGYYKISTSHIKGEWLYSYLLSYGNYLEVIEPKDIRNEIKNRIQQMMNQY